MNTVYTCPCLNVNIRLIRIFNNLREDEISIINNRKLIAGTGSNEYSFIAGEVEKSHFIYEELIINNNIFTTTSYANLYTCKNCLQDCFITRQNSSKILFNSKLKSGSDIARLKQLPDYSNTFKIVLRPYPIDITIDATLYNHLLRQAKEVLDKAKLDREAKIAEFTRIQNAELTQVESKLRIEFSTLISKHTASNNSSSLDRRVSTKPNINACSPLSSSLRPDVLNEFKSPTLCIAPSDILHDLSANSDVLTTSFAPIEELARLSVAEQEQAISLNAALPRVSPILDPSKLISFTKNVRSSSSSPTLLRTPTTDYQLDLDDKTKPKITVNSVATYETTTSGTISSEHIKRVHIEEQFPLEEDADLNQVSTPYIKDDIIIAKDDSSIAEEDENFETSPGLSLLNGKGSIEFPSHNSTTLSFNFKGAGSYKNRMKVGSLPMEISKPFGLASSLFQHRPQNDRAPSPTPDEFQKIERTNSVVEKKALEKEQWPHTLTEPSFWSLATDIDLRSLNYRPIAHDKDLN